MYITAAETESYAIQISVTTDVGMLIRKIDGHYCYLSDTDTNMLIDYVDKLIDEFTIICNSFTFIDPLLERAAYANY